MARIKEVTHDLVPQVAFDLGITMYDKTNSIYKNCTIYRCHRIPDLYGHPAAAVTDLHVKVDSGTAFLEFAADPARTYLIEASIDLQDWTEIGSAEAEEDGVYNFEDSDSANARGRYYRILTE